jgi:hypothetical protein
MNKFWEKLYKRTLLLLGALVVLWLLGLILGDKDPEDFIWESFWAVVWIASTISFFIFIYFLWKSRKK